MSFLFYQIAYWGWCTVEFDQLKWEKGEEVRVAEEGVREMVRRKDEGRGKVDVEG